MTWNCPKISAAGFFNVGYNLIPTVNLTIVWFIQRKLDVCLIEMNWISNQWSTPWFWIAADRDINNLPTCSISADGIRTQLLSMCTLVRCLIYSAVQRRYLMYTVEITHFDPNFTIIRQMIVARNCIWSCTITFLFSLHYCFCSCPSSGLFFLIFWRKLCIVHF